MSAAVWSGGGAQLVSLAPGLVVVVAIALVARATSLAAPVVPEILIAVVLGIVIASVASVPAATRSGVRFAIQRVLRIGIVLLGARLSLEAALAIGVGSLALVLASVTVAFIVALAVGRAVRIPGRLGLLIAVGTAICGNSAIIATAPVIDADERDVSLAVATITLFGTLALFVFPLAGRLLGLGDVTYGLWSGVAVNDTSQVVAASSAFSPAARDVATVTKLVRNTLMAPLIIAIALWWRGHHEVDGAKVGRSVRNAFPVFVLGFLGMAVLRSIGAISPAAAAVLDELAKGCILVALAGVGLNTNARQLRGVGIGPFLAGLATAGTIAALTLVVIVMLRLGG